MAEPWMSQTEALADYYDRKAREEEKQEALKTPEEWSRLLDVTILDPDGWRYDGKRWEEPITRKEFMWRWAMSTQRAGYTPRRIR